MTEVRRYVLPGGRELRATVAAGRFVIAIHDLGTSHVATLSVHRGELAAVRRALADLAAGQKRPRAGTA
ncbi:MAG TPA: hypothetical protein VH853_00415 [Polyangia bacterium]|nr:hypothetical protein [Polyangia bacterium]